ncbi:MAG: hypothetical protein ACFCU7_13500 [Pleurocapsa sp.]
MTIKEKRSVNISFPFGLYFQQLFSTDTYVRLINPFSFWHQYKINHLESCCELDTVAYLERCHQIEWRRAKLFAPEKANRLTQTSAFNCFPLRQIEPKTIFIVQPSRKLKYRGVIYHTQEILGMNINYAQVDPSFREINSLEQPLNSRKIW